MSQYLKIGIVLFLIRLKCTPSISKSLSIKLFSLLLFNYYIEGEIYTYPDKILLIKWILVTVNKVDLCFKIPKVYLSATFPVKVNVWARSYQWSPLAYTHFLWETKNHLYCLSQSLLKIRRDHCWLFELSKENYNLSVFSTLTWKISNRDFCLPYLSDTDIQGVSWALGWLIRYLSNILLLRLWQSTNYWDVSYLFVCLFIFGDGVYYAALADPKFLV